MIWEILHAANDNFCYLNKEGQRNLVDPNQHIEKLCLLSSHFLIVDQMFVNFKFLKESNIVQAHVGPASTNY